MAMAISCRTRSADVSELWLRQITHSGRSERISMGTPIRTSPSGSRHDPLVMSAWSLNSKRKRFFQSVFGLGWGRRGCACISPLYHLCHAPEVPGGDPTPKPLHNPCAAGRAHTECTSTTHPCSPTIKQAAPPHRDRVPHCFASYVHWPMFVGSLKCEHKCCWHQ